MIGLVGLYKVVFKTKNNNINSKGFNFQILNNYVFFNFLCKHNNVVFHFTSNQCKLTEGTIKNTSIF